MNKKPYGVHVIVDPTFGDRLWGLPEGEPAWIADTETNAPIYAAIVKQRDCRDYLVSLSSFRVAPDETPEQWLLSILGTVDLHHNEMSHDPPYSWLNVIGTSWSDRIETKLKEYGFTEHQHTHQGFTAQKGSSGQQAN